MRYLVRARIKQDKEEALLRAIDEGTLGAGSIAGGEYVRDMDAARLCDDGTARWVEVCYCPTPLEEELPYWEEFFDIVKIQDAHARKKCLDENGAKAWACGNCDCTTKLEARMVTWGPPFVEELKEQLSPRTVQTQTLQGD